MDAKFRVPIAFMLLGLAACVLLSIWFVIGGAPDSGPVWVPTALFAGAGGLILLSGVS